MCARMSVSAGMTNSTRKTYENEKDKKKCAALKALMDDGHISKGEIDDRPIQEVRGSDLRGYNRCHFFAGIGLWDYALHLAGRGDAIVAPLAKEFIQAFMRI